MFDEEKDSKKDLLKEARKKVEAFCQQRKKALFDLKTLLQRINGNKDQYFYRTNPNVNITISTASLDEAMQILSDMEEKHKIEERSKTQESYREKATRMNIYSKDHPYGE